LCPTIFVFFPGYFLSVILAPFFSAEESCRRDVLARKLNGSDEPCRADVIEKTSREIGKAFLSPVRFLKPAVNSA
jgi:hypothetical protein